MQFEEYFIESITHITSRIYTIRIKPKDRKTVPPFTPGQFFHIKNPTYHNQIQTRPFSVATTPATKEYLEFCIKPYGPWTEALLHKRKGESIWLFGPMGVFTFEKESEHAVFIAGGIGITPVLSILQSLYEQNYTRPVTVIYANKTPDSIFRKIELEDMFKQMPLWTLHQRTSSIEGRITKQFLEELSFPQLATFFVSGSHQFTKDIVALLETLGIKTSSIKQEIFSPPTPSDQ